LYPGSSVLEISPEKEEANISSQTKVKARTKVGR
jgi:hypothetical protein